MSSIGATSEVFEWVEDLIRFAPQPDQPTIVDHERRFAQRLQTELNDRELNKLPGPQPAISSLLMGIVLGWFASDIVDRHRIIGNTLSYDYGN